MNTFVYFRATYQPDKKLINVGKEVKNYRIVAKGHLPITATESIDMDLRVNKNGTQNYTMQYRDNHSGLQIRCDTAHRKPHIDIVWPGEKQNKQWLTKIPKNYEEAINLILINAEQNNPRIGAMYWIMPGLIAYDDKVDQLEQLKNYHGINTPLTIVARAVTVELLNEAIKRKGKPMSSKEVIQLFKEQCKEIAELERKEGGPLEIKEVNYRNDILAFPFKIVNPPNAHFTYEYYPKSDKNAMDNIVGIDFSI